MTLTTDPRPASGNAARGGRALMVYIQTRLRCRFARRLKPADYPRLAGMDFDQIAHALTETTYGEAARNLNLQLGGERLIHAMVREELDFEVRAVRRICAASPAATAWLDAYAWKFDLMALRQALRARATRGEFTESAFAPLMNQPFGVYERLAAGAPFTE
ncbi:MAG: V-type ATPase subunit [Planctomycetota bacterium]